MDTMLSGSPERRFGKWIVLGAVGGAAVMVAMALMLPTAPSKARSKPRTKAVAEAPPPPAPPPAPVEDVEAAHRALAQARLAGTPDEQLAGVAKALEHKRDFVPALLYRAEIHALMGRSADAYDDYSAAIAAAKDPELNYLRADLAAKLGRHRESAEDYGVVIAARPGADVYLRRGVQRTLSDDRAGAIADFDAAIGIDALVVEAVGCRAVTLALDGRLDEALVAVDVALKQDASLPSAHLARSCVWARRAVEALDAAAGEESTRKAARAASIALADRMMVTAHDLLAPAAKVLAEMEPRLTGEAMDRALSWELAQRASELGGDWVYGGITDRLFTMAAERDAASALPHALRGFQRYGKTCDSRLAQPDLRAAERIAPAMPEVRALRGLLRMDSAMRAVAALVNEGKPAPARRDGEDVRWASAFYEGYRDLQEYFSHARTRTEESRLQKMLEEFVKGIGQLKGSPRPATEVAERLSAMAAEEQSKCLDCAIGSRRARSRWTAGARRGGRRAGRRTSRRRASRRR